MRKDIWIPVKYKEVWENIPDVPKWLREALEKERKRQLKAKG